MQLCLERILFKRGMAMAKRSFVWQYLFKPRTVGAVLPSSKYLARKMVKSIDFENAKCIVEYGSGTGVFTEYILQMRNAATIVILFETNEMFYQMLEERYKEEPNVYIVRDSAENVGWYLEKYNIQCVDYVVSGLPFASLPVEVSMKILQQTKLYMNPAGGNFITFQYTLFKKDFIQQFFDTIEVTRELRNVPPAYVLRCY